ncbi:MAG: ATP-dependent 6-phosphofructokinase [Thermoprotei archaeon]|nr:ATP-dependent 6-phosphofructokinase [TACK group archaeon]
MKIALATTGGDAPGMNAAIRSVVRLATEMGHQVYGIRRGYCGLIERDWWAMGPRDVSGIVNQGGTILRTLRCPYVETEEGLSKACEALSNFDALIVIGGDGSIRGGWALHERCGIKVVAVPASIDNDIAGTDTTIGFDTAVNTAVEAIDKIRDTATSHERVFVVEVMGRARGFLAVSVALAAGAEMVLIPEHPFTLSEIESSLDEGEKKGKSSSIIVMAEGAGYAPSLVERLARDRNYSVRLSVLGYMQRGGNPTATSRLLGALFGEEALHAAEDDREQAWLVASVDGKVVHRPLVDALKPKDGPDMRMFDLVSRLAV